MVTSLKWNSIPLSEIIKNKKRLEAIVFQLIGKAGEKRCVCRGNGALYLNKLRHIVTDFSGGDFHKLA